MPGAAAPGAQRTARVLTARRQPAPAKPLPMPATRRSALARRLAHRVVLPPVAPLVASPVAPPVAAAAAARPVAPAPGGGRPPVGRAACAARPSLADMFRSRRRRVASIRRCQANPVNRREVERAMHAAACPRLVRARPLLTPMWCLLDLRRICTA